MLSIGEYKKKDGNQKGGREIMVVFFFPISLIVAKQRILSRDGNIILFSSFLGLANVPLDEDKGAGGKNCQQCKYKP